MTAAELPPLPPANNGSFSTAAHAAMSTASVVVFLAVHLGTKEVIVSRDRHVVVEWERALLVTYSTTVGNTWYFKRVT